MNPFKKSPKRFVEPLEKSETREYQIRHLFKENNFLVQPRLGRMNLLDHWFKPDGFARIGAEKVEQVMKWMKQVPFVFFNLFLLPVPAFASDLIMSDPN
jgi:hypothetical protein